MYEFDEKCQSMIWMIGQLSILAVGNLDHFASFYFRNILTNIDKKQISARSINSSCTIRYVCLWSFAPNQSSGSWHINLETDDLSRIMSV